MRRTLTLRRETLAALTSDELAAVAAGVEATGGCPRSFRVRECLTMLTCDVTCMTEAH